MGEYGSGESHIGQKECSEKNGAGIRGEDGVGHIESGRTFGRVGRERGKGGGGEPYRAEEGMFGERMAWGILRTGRTFGRLVRNKAAHYPGALGVPFRLRQSQGDRKRINVLLHAVRMAPQHPVEVATVAGRSPAGQTPPGRSWRASAPGWGRSSGCTACWSLSAPSPA